MACEGLKGIKRTKCIKEYVSRAKKTYANFDAKRDTMVTYSNTAPQGLMMSKKQIMAREKPLAVSKITKSTDKKDKYPYKLNVVKRKKK